MSRLPNINGSNSQVIDENSFNSLFDVHPIPEANEINAVYSASQSRSNVGSPKYGNPLRKSVLKDHVYEGSLSQLQSIPFPQLDPDQTMKNRISNLEATTLTQNKFNTLTGQTFRNMGAHVNNVELALRDIMQEMQSNYDIKLNTMKKEYDHRFELQASENKRLQNHVAQLKADSSNLKKKLQNTSDKLRKLQQEFGAELEDEVMIEETSTFSVTGFTTASRPHTIH